MDTESKAKSKKQKESHYKATVFWRVFLHQFTFFLIIFSGLIVSHYLFLLENRGLLGPENLDRFLDRSLLFIGGAFLATVVYLFISGYNFFLPLKRLLFKATKLRKASLQEIEWSADEQEEDLGEWGELDEALMKIHKTLDKKRRQFRMEREELQSIVSTVDDAIVAIGRDFDLRYYNSKFAVLFKQKRKEELLGSVKGIFSEDVLFKSMGQALEGKSTKDIRLQLPTSRHPKPRFFRVSVSPLRNEKEELPYGAVAIFHDETEAKTAENIRIEFVANASHELRTPLTSIHGYLQTIKEDLREERYGEIEKFLSIVLRNVERLKDLVTDLLEISSLESGAEIKKDLVPVAETTEMVLHQLEELRSQKNIKISTQMDVAKIYVDGHKLEQVLINLVHNSLKYVPEGSDINIRWFEESKDWDILVVEDNGPGIPLEHQDRLFERFYRLDKGRAREFGGTGLGLSIVKHIMIKHGGRVDLESEPGKGTKFICRFPKKGMEIGPELSFS